MKRSSVAVLTAILLVAGLLSGSMASTASAGHNDDDHSDNFKQVARVPIKIDKDVFAQGSDLAFKGNTLYAGTFEGLGVFRLLPTKPHIKQLGFAQCAGGQGDVTVSGNHVFFSVDSTLTGPTCKPEDTAAAPPNMLASGTHWEGLRIFDVSDPQHPRWVKSIAINCGSHTNTLLPGPTTSYIYIESYPVSGQNPNCNYASHRKVQIVEFPTADPSKAKLLDKTIDVTPAPGCHDITTFPDRKLMVGACIDQSMVWSIENPLEPELLATIVNEDIQIHHSTAMSWDGKILILGDEYSGATGVGGCTGDEDSTIGAAWFYDISDPSAPVLKGHHSLPRVPQAGPEEGARFMCTNHNFNVIPVRSNKYLLAVSYYMGGIAVVDFTDPTDPTEVAHYLTRPGGVSQDTWAAYWYNGRIYTNDYRSRLGVGVYKFRGTVSQLKTRYFKGEMNPQVQFEANLRK